MKKHQSTTDLPAHFLRAFKPADIRGIYPEEINETVVHRTARAFVKNGRYKKIVLGYDMRVSTPALRHAFITGARAAGATVIDVGQCRSPFLYFASGHLKLPGAMITASHSPAAYNGLKLVKAKAIPLTAETGLNAIKALVAQGTFTDAKKPGALIKKGLRREYRSYLLGNVDRTLGKGQIIVADIGNGMAGRGMEYIDKTLAATFTMLFPEPDGNFPNRGSDPCLRKNQKALVAEIKKQRADFGIGFDGDGDRIAFLDEKGRYVNCAAIGTLISQWLLEREPKAGIVFTNLCSRIFPETISAKGGKAIRAKVGHTFLKEKLRTKGAVFGAEHSGHFFWRDFFSTDSTTLTLLAVMEIYAAHKASGRTFSRMMKPFTQYHQTEDVVVSVANKKRALQLMEKKVQSMKPVSVTAFDGYFVDFGDVWGAIKPSVTEYAIKLMFESRDKKRAVAVQKELLAHLMSIKDND